MLAALEQDVALVGLVDAGDQVEERRLAGAVRADHADDLALVDVQVELGDDLQAAERERDAAQLEQRRPASDDLHAALAEQAVRAHDHQRDQEHAEHDVARRVGLREHHVLPHERGEVQRRHEQDDRGAQPRTSVSTRIERDQRRRRTTGPTQRVELVGTITQCASVPARPPACSPADPRRGASASAIACAAKPKTTIAAGHDARACARAGTRRERRAGRRGRRGCATSPGSRSSSSSDADHERAEHDAGVIALAAEDDHRVDGDQRARNENDEREHAGVQRREERPGERRDGRAEGEAMSFSRLTGMPIASAASGSSRSERHARPVREWLTKCSAT